MKYGSRNLPIPRHATGSVEHCATEQALSRFQDGFHSGLVCYSSEVETAHPRPAHIAEDWKDTVTEKGKKNRTSLNMTGYTLNGILFIGYTVRGEREREEGWNKQGGEGRGSGRERGRKEGREI